MMRDLLRFDGATISFLLRIRPGFTPAGPGRSDVVSVVREAWLDRREREKLLSVRTERGHRP